MANVYVCKSCGLSVTVDRYVTSHDSCPARAIGGHQWSKAGTVSYGGAENPDGAQEDLFEGSGRAGWAAYVLPAAVLLIFSPAIAAVLDVILVLVFGIGGEDGMFTPIVDSVLGLFWGGED